MSLVGLRSEKGCADDARQKLKTTDPTSRQRGEEYGSTPEPGTESQSSPSALWGYLEEKVATPV
jgi:hypothetical protein